MIRLGGGGINVQTNDPWEVARAHRRFGYTAAFCPQVELIDGERIKEIREAFLKEDVLIAEVSAWCNLVDPDAQKRKSNFAYVCERLALADEVGALCCIDFIGSVAPNALYAPHPFNWKASNFVWKLFAVLLMQSSQREPNLHLNLCNGFYRIAQKLVWN